MAQWAYFGPVHDWRALLSSEPEESARLRHHVRTGRPLGSRGFIETAERLLGRRLRPRPAGPPSKDEKWVLCPQIPQAWPANMARRFPGSVWVGDTPGLPAAPPLSLRQLVWEFVLCLFCEQSSDPSWQGKNVYCIQYFLKMNFVNFGDETKGYYFYKGADGHYVRPPVLKT